MASSRPEAREGVKIPVPVLIVAALAIGGAWWWLETRDTSEPPPSWSDVDAGTTPIQERLESFRASWNAADLDAVRSMCMLPADSDRDLLLDRRVKENGWDAGLPTVDAPTAERTGPHRYTVSWPVEGFTAPIVTYWEWDQGTWRIASWKIPQAS